MYDPLYERLNLFTAQTGIQVKIGFKGDHIALNEHLAHTTGQPYDLVSTHTKYAPSQKHFLAPLDDLFSQEEKADFVPLLLNLAHIDGQLYGIPRNIDVRLLHYRTDLLTDIPGTWDELLETARQFNQPPQTYGFVFPGMESGLFGTFFELAEAAGARLFPDNLIPEVENEGGRWALNFLRSAYQEGFVPPEITHWHFDKVHNFFRDGQAAMVGDWPGYYQDYCDPQNSKVSGRFNLDRYPAGPSGKSRVYGGGHTFALTPQGLENSEAQAVLKFLTAPEQQLLEAQHGSVPVRSSIMKQIQSGALPAELKRWQILETVIQEDIIIPPRFARYPEVEEVLWKTVQAGMTGKLSVDQALRQMTLQIGDIVKSIHG
jgi:multiple sugar transport system substrate-binding protein